MSNLLPLHVQTKIQTTVETFLILLQCRSKGNISGGGGTRAAEARAARGVWGHAPPEKFEI